MGWRRGTNPTFIVKVKGIAVTDLQTLWLTLKQGSVEITKYLDDVTLDEEANKIEVHLSQEDTLAFSKGNVDIQVRALTKEGQAIGTNIKTKPIGAILKDGVIE